MLGSCQAGLCLILASWPSCWATWFLFAKERVRWKSQHLKPVSVFYKPGEPYLSWRRAEQLALVLPRHSFLGQSCLWMCQGWWDYGCGEIVDGCQLLPWNNPFLAVSIFFTSLPVGTIGGITSVNSITQVQRKKERKVVLVNSSGTDQHTNAWNCNSEKVEGKWMPVPEWGLWGFWYAQLSKLRAQWRNSATANKHNKSSIKWPDLGSPPVVLEEG